MAEAIPPEIAVILLIAIVLWAANNIPEFTDLIAGGSSTTSRSYTASHLQRADPETFERLVADAWENQGYSTALTSSGADEGIDVIANSEAETVVIQAKRYIGENKVSAPTVRKVAGAASQFGADRAAIATSTTFTAPAHDAADDLNIELVDGSKLASWLATGEWPDH